MPIPFVLDGVVEKLSGGNSGLAEQVRLREVAGLRLSREEARSVWPRIQEHKWYLGERLGRDVGLSVAAQDFCRNVEPWLWQRSEERKPSARIERWLQAAFAPTPIRPEYSIWMLDRTFGEPRRTVRQG